MVWNLILIDWLWAIFQLYSLPEQVKNNKSCSKKGCDRMVVGFTTTYAISAYHH